MNLLFVTENRFIEGPDGFIYSDPAFDFSLWEQYLVHFDSITVIARIQKSSVPLSHSYSISSGKGVSFYAIPSFQGPIGFFLKIPQIFLKIYKGLTKHPDSILLCRVPGNLGNITITLSKLLKRPYGIEVVGDPWDVFAPGSIKLPFRPFFRWYYYSNLKKNVNSAKCVKYVTTKSLQLRYPAKIGSFSIGVSDVILSPSLINTYRKIRALNSNNNFRIISIGSLDQMYKSPDIVIRAIYDLKKVGLNLSLTWLGDGIFKNDLLQLAKELGVHDQVYFLGNVSKADLFKELDSSDLFVLVSRTEGLPRALVEAMSIGLPCIGSKVGGIPELLDSDSLVNPGSVAELCSTIIRFYSEPEFYRFNSEENFKKSEQFFPEILLKHRKSFFDALKKM